MQLQKTFHLLLSSLLFLGLTSLVLNQYFGKTYSDILILIGALFTLLYNAKGHTFSKNEEALILFGVGAFLIALTGFFQQDPELTRFGPSLESYTNTLTPLLVLPLLYFLKITNIKFLVNSILLAAITAGLISLLIDIPSQLPRYHRTHGAPIIFGDLAMLFGLLSLSFSFLYFKKETLQFSLLIIGGILGITASLYSGSRGGWVALLTVPFLFILSAPKEQRIKFFALGLTILTALLAGVLLTENPVNHRIQQAVNEINKLIEDPNWAGGSIGSRLVFYKISILAFLSNPIFGIGIGEFYGFKMATIAAHPEQFPNWLIKYKHSHNEYLGILSGMGLVGVIFYTFFFVWLIRFFKNALRNIQQPTKALGLAGLTLIFCYLDFSLSESFLSSKLGSFAFYFIVTLLVYFITNLKNSKVPSS